MNKQVLIDPLTTLKVKIYLHTLYLGLSVIIAIWTMSFVFHNLDFLDQIMYPFLGVLCLLSILLLKRKNLSYIKLFEYVGYAIIFIYFVLVFVRGINAGIQGERLNFQEIFLWLAILYAFSFLIFPSRRAVYWSGLFIACLVLLGTIYIIRTWERPNFIDNMMVLFQVYASGAVYISVLYAIALLKDKFAESEIRTEAMTMLANVDALTGVYNRRKISELLDYWIASSNESMHIFSVIMLDIDKMKRINDDYGHDAGDYVLRHLAEVLKMNLRETDLLGRWGGDEFLIICPKSNFEHTVQLSKRLENAVQVANFITIGNMTVSTGVATYEHNDTSDSLFKRADTGLYLAKEAKNPPA